MLSSTRQWQSLRRNSQSCGYVIWKCVEDCDQSGEVHSINLLLSLFHSIAPSLMKVRNDLGFFPHKKGVGHFTNDNWCSQ